MNHDLYEEFNLRRVVNASGTLTADGQSVALPAVVSAVAEALPRFLKWMCFMLAKTKHNRPMITTNEELTFGASALY